jgi:hypothetical protein
MQAYGIDKELKFHRKTTIHSFSIDKLKLYSSHFNNPERDIELALVGFCGSLYPIMIVTPTIIFKDSQGIQDTIKRLDKEMKVYYDYNEFCKDNGLINNYFTGRRFYNYGHLDTNFNTIAELFNLHLSNFWHITNCPYFLLRNQYDSKIKIDFIENPTLADYKFQQIKSADEAYQEISQFLGNIKTRNKPEIKELSNNDSIVKAGFNLKTSFRKGKIK